jgi:hypothetical protein
LNAHPCTCNELARIVRATLRAFLRTLAAPQGPRLGGHPARSYAPTPNAVIYIP